MLLLVVLSSCSANEVARDPGAGRLTTLPVCFDMTPQEYESALAAGVVHAYSKEAFDSGVRYANHISCGLFAGYLRAADSWYLVDLDKDTEAYQVLYLQPFSRAVLVRVVASRGQSPVVSAVRMLGPWGDDIGEIDRTTSRPMSQSEWQRWSRLVEQLGFWAKDPPFEKDDVVCMHGATFLLEGSRFERGAGVLDSVKHKVWYPYCPQGEVGDGLWEATWFLFDLTQTYPREG